MARAVAYVLGWIVIVPFASLPGIYVGPIAKKMHGIDIAWLVSLTTAGLFYYLASLSFSPESEQAAIAASERDLEGSLRTSHTRSRRRASRWIYRCHRASSFHDKFAS